MREGTADRAIGALLGLAVGDALGTTLEFARRDAQPLHTEMTGGGVFGLPPGFWTDDTTLALALAESLAERRGFEPRDVMDRFLAWFERGEYSPSGEAFDIGNTTRAALTRYRREGEPFAGSTDPREGGNGSLMRLAPVAIVAGPDPRLARRLGEEQSRLTHAAPEPVQASGWFAEVLQRAIAGTMTAVPEDLPAFGGDSAAIRRIAERSWLDKRRQEIRSSGYVVHTLEAALWAVSQTRDFEGAVVLAVNLGEDADSVGAVAGQLAGALYGGRAIPARWLERLAWRPRLQKAAESLHAIGWGEAPSTV